MKQHKKKPKQKPIPIPKNRMGHNLNDLETGLLQKTELTKYMKQLLPCPNYASTPDEDCSD